MRNSYFATDVMAIVTALGERTSRSERIDTILNDIEHKLARQLADELSPEREWRQRTARPLTALAKVMRLIGKPTPSVESLATELAI